MSDRRSRIAYALEQSPGTTMPELPQQDRVRVDEIQTGGGVHLILAVVVDGDGHRKADEAAEIFINQLFSGITQSTNRDLNDLLRDQLEEGARFLFKRNSLGEGIGEIGITAVAIHGDRLFFAHGGHTMAALVREGETIQITRPGDRLLGSSETPQIQTGDPRGITLQAGDRVVLASDGLTRISPEDGYPYVGMEKIATYVEGNTPEAAARHLISLALGRDVDDNVSVAVLQIRGERVRMRPMAVLIPIAFLLALGVIGISRLQRKDAEPRVDYGYVVLVQGSAGLMNEEGTGVVKAVGYLGTIPAGARIVSNERTRFALETTFEGANKLAGMSLYLDRDAQIQLTSLDPHGDPTRAFETPAESITMVNLISGRLMVVRDEGDQELHITWNGITAVLAGEGAGALGIWDDGEELVLDCLQGRCKNLVTNGVSTMLEGGQRCVFITASETKVENLPQNSFLGWNELCGGCLVEQ